jgi:Capsule assembly protein Wzi/PAP2 superfamily
MKSAGVVLTISLVVFLAAAFPCAAQQQDPPASQGSPTETTDATPPAAALEPDSDPNSTPPADPFQETTLGASLLKNIARDQAAIWTSPARIREGDAVWLVPLVGATAALIATDRDTSGHLNSDPSTIKRYQNISNYGVYGLVGISGGMYLWGHFTNDDHKRETGLLAGEAAIDSLAVAEALKYSTGRARPLQDMGRGQFLQGGTSFPSEHSAIAWSTAGILAHEYPGIFTRILAYGLAATVSGTRVTGKEHFSSDALVGSALGFLTSEYVYRTHHDPSLGGSDWNFVPFHLDSKSWQPRNMGSPFVPLDSWIYPALDRLEALGYIQEGIQDMRPWTRMQCARLLSESSEAVRGSEGDHSDALPIFDSLEKEFAAELGMLDGGDNRHARLESLYARATEIAGPPQTDGYHFAQSIIDDYGRPFEQGFNDVTGFSAWGTDGPFVGYIRGEEQHAPMGSVLPLSARQEISDVDFRPIFQAGQGPVPPAVAAPDVTRFNLLDSYVGMTLGNWEVSYGKQSLWWGPGGAGSPMIFSDNAEPINMFRVSRVWPSSLPGLLRYLGPVETQAFIGQIAGDNFIYGQITGLIGAYGSTYRPQPIIHGQRVAFKPTPNFEFALSKTTLYGGPGQPVTTHNFLRSVFGLGNGLPGTSTDPGDRRSSFDMTYRLPKMRNWVTFYADGFAEDEISPVAYWDRSAWRSGLYFPRIPHIRHLDLQVEGVFTDLPAGGNLSYGFFYYNSRYINGYTNNGVLLANWIGREGQGAQAWSNYWFSPRSRLQFYYRHQKVSQQFITYGGTLTDGGVRQDFWLKSILSVSWQMQYETWLFPIIASQQKTNVSTSIQLMLWSPSWGRK